MSIILKYEGGPRDGHISRVHDFVHPVGEYVNKTVPARSEGYRHRYVSHERVPHGYGKERVVRMVYCGVVSCRV